MREFKPGSDWREVQRSEWEAAPAPTLVLHDGPPATRYWVRANPVPPLPTEPHTVIRVTWKSDVDFEMSDVLMLQGSGWWGRGLWFTPRQVAESITGFEVLAEPVGPWRQRVEYERRETARAVLDRVRQRTWDPRDLSLADIAREFGVGAGS